MTSLQIGFPFKGLNRNERLAVQPPETSRDLVNVWPVDRTTGRLRGGPRPGTSKYFTGFMSGSGNKVQALSSVAYQARHVNFSADSIPDEMWALQLASTPTLNVLAPGLYDDFYTTVNNNTLLRYSRYGTQLASIAVPNPNPGDLKLDTLEVADDGAVYVATSDFVTTAASITSSRIWKFVTDDTGVGLQLEWEIGHPSGGRAVHRLRKYGDTLYSLEGSIGVGTESAELVSYSNINGAGGPNNGVRTVLKAISGTDLNALDAQYTAGSGTTFGHDMALKTNNGVLEWVIAGGTVRNAGAGIWFLLKVKSDLTLSANYLIVNNEASATTANRAGGIGYACEVDSIGSVCSMGRRNANDDVWVRKIVDTSTAWSLAQGWSRTEATDLGGAGNNPTFGYPKMQIDKYGNLYVPTARNTAGVTAAKVLNSAGVAFTSIQHRYYLVGVPTNTNNECRAVCIPTTYPAFQDDDTKTADTVFVGGSPIVTLLADPATASAHGYDILLETENVVSSRNTAHLGVAAGNVVKFTSAGTVNPTNSTGRDPPLSAQSRFVQMADEFGEVFMTDGSNYAVYKPSPPGSAVTYPNGRLVNWSATSLGLIPQRCRLMARWRGRMVLAHSSDSPYGWYMSAFSDPYNWDIAPPEPLPTQAVTYLSVPYIGAQPQPIHALIPWSDDLMYFGCDHLIQRLTGDPLAGGAMHLVSDETGIAFGKAWCKDPEGRIYFFGTRGGVYVMSPTGELGWLTRDTIEEELADVDLSANRVELIWNARDNGLHVWIFPHGTGGTHLRHFFWSQRTGGWFPVEMGTSLATTMQPTACCTIDGDLPGERVMLLGTEDGRTLKWDADAASDDGQPIDARVLIGPMAGPDGDLEAKFERPSVVLADELGSCHVKFFASDTPETPTIPNTETRVGPGVNARLPIRARGSWAWAQLRSSSRTTSGVPMLAEKWALESFNVEAHAGGRKRVRS